MINVPYFSVTIGHSPVINILHLYSRTPLLFLFSNLTSSSFFLDVGFIFGHLNSVERLKYAIFSLLVNNQFQYFQDCYNVWKNILRALEVNTKFL
jgi:hypothetical protein